jgi:hypothetical protein
MIRPILGADYAITRLDNTYSVQSRYVNVAHI